jgi:hypothetical protein
MADIFISYESSDRPRAEALRSWFEELGWSVWIDREINVGEGWEHRIEKELSHARLVVVLWGAQARRSEWVQREAEVAQSDGRLLQIHATGLPLLSPFDKLQAVRMQSWSGEAEHSERARLLAAVAGRLGADLSAMKQVKGLDSALPRLNYDLVEALELAFYYCARQLECRRHARGGDPQEQDWKEIRESFNGLVGQLQAEKLSSSDDREGILHRMVEDFLDQLELLVPVPGRVR